MENPHLSSVAILPKLPDHFQSQRGDDFPQDLIGAKIIAFGAPDLEYEDKPEGGGLVIDYLAGEKVRRVVFAFNELGMWVDFSGDRDQATSPAQV